MGRAGHPEEMAKGYHLPMGSDDFIGNIRAYGHVKVKSVIFCIFRRHMPWVVPATLKRWPRPLPSLLLMMPPSLQENIIFFIAKKIFS